MVKLNKIYTRTGDDGTTGLVDGSRISKSDARLHAIGEVDEANCAIGVAVECLESDPKATALVRDLRRIQNDLFDLGADIATPGSSFEPSPMELRIIPAQVKWLEDTIDRANEELPALTSFILPGGSIPAAHMHMARAISRRAERALVAASQSVSINPNALEYINRLSDYLFVLCRVINASRNGDVMWVPGASR
ncbi:cob(I)yrinic acid a,c-diamide adenosyltransferase [Sphingorhabdus contaminans]|uniref:Corrinoid adenosyltransferase n=1 Tax=Sphingorhabdus contaminans TaxID=1343899 RepID=A0A553W9D0_9SPHN|nr:cob(I)yrinic acid a,c-diamide adenosyltransferase [Sphingorhabdus contaminans]TSB01297.1 cob(I)yrinic acid a,c-diamide adenosyltransferase [Sphingorhabdus contaminans]